MTGISKWCFTSNYSKVKEVQEDIAKLHEQVLVKHYVDAIHFDIPKNLTREVYV